jgi:copper chaperone NosL
MFTLHRRGLMTAASASAFALLTTRAMAQDKPVAPWVWADQNGLVRDLPKDKEPLNDGLKKYPRCRYCGMERAKFSHSRHLLVYEADSAEGTCSIHCSAISLSLNMDRGPKAIYAGDAGAADEIRPLVLVARRSTSSTPASRAR